MPIQFNFGGFDFGNFSGGGQDGQGGFAPVSYTHLDVYKRQAVSFVMLPRILRSSKARTYVPSA